MNESHLLREVLLLLCLVAASASSACNVCNTVNSMSCYSLNQIQACEANHLPIGRLYNCPLGHVCVSGAGGVLCQPVASGKAACQDKCNKCDATRTFACTGPSSFALCLGTNKPQNSKGSCAAGYVCNNNDAQICALKTQVKPTCSYADATTTTTTATTTQATPSTSNPTTYCNTVQSKGKFPVGDYAATTCRQYIECFLLDGIWNGRKYNCPGSTYFSRTTGLCVISMPSNCYTPISTTTTTTVAPTTSNPAAYCAKMQSQDYFPVGTNPSSSCRQYIYCFLLNDSWHGKMYTCPGKLYYSSSQKRCVSSLPPTCSTAVASLSLNEVQLN